MNAPKESRVMRWFRCLVTGSDMAPLPRITPPALMPWEGRATVSQSEWLLKLIASRPHGQSIDSPVYGAFTIREIARMIADKTPAHDQEEP